MHGASMRRWQLDETVRQVGGMLITDFRGEANHHSFVIEALAQVKKHVESRNTALSPMRVFIGSTP